MKLKKLTKVVFGMMALGTMAFSSFVSLASAAPMEGNYQGCPYGEI